MKFEEILKNMREREHLRKDWIFYRDEILNSERGYGSPLQRFDSAEKEYNKWIIRDNKIDDILSDIEPIKK